MKSLSLLWVLLVLITAAPAHADARDRAKRMYDRLVGVPPSEARRQLGHGFDPALSRFVP